MTFKRSAALAGGAAVLVVAVVLAVVYGPFDGTTTVSPSAQACPPYPAFPDANCTGVPSGVTLTAYTGSCTVTADGAVIDAKTVNCAPLSIRAKNVVIRNSRVNG